MQKKTIDKRINKKVNEWIETITDAKLRKEIKDEVIVTGGCITSMFLGEEPNDYDVYFRTIEMTERVAKYYVDKFKEQNTGNSGIEVVLRDENLVLSNGMLGYSGEDSLETFDGNHVQCAYIYVPSGGYAKAGSKKLNKHHDSGKQDVSSEKGKTLYNPIFLSGNAITLECGIQLIVRFSGTPDIIHENFDFAHTKMYWTKDDGVVTNTMSLECVLSRRLVYTGSKYPICSIMRSKKFLQRTHKDNRRWTMDVGQYLKMVVQASVMDLSSPRVMFDQLCGVDTAYFHWVIEECCTNDQGLLEDGSLDFSYFLGVINKVFDNDENSED